MLEACEACLSAMRIAATHGDACNYENFAKTIMADLASLVGPVLAANNVPDSVNEVLLYPTTVQNGNVHELNNILLI